MKRILLLVTVALLLAGAMALSGVAQAKPISTKADAQCAKLAIKTLGPSVNPANYTFIGGTEGNDAFDSQATSGNDVFCGFGGHDRIGIFEVTGTLDQGDIFLGGAGGDSVLARNEGTFYGGDGDDSVDTNYGTFYGEAGNDSVVANGGTFNGGADTDSVTTNTGIIDSVP